VRHRPALPVGIRVFGDVLGHPARGRSARQVRLRWTTPRRSSFGRVRPAGYHDLTARMCRRNQGCGSMGRPNGFFGQYEVRGEGRDRGGPTVAWFGSFDFSREAAGSPTGFVRQFRSFDFFREGEEGARDVSTNVNP
jgi:hypothetical protein